MSQTIEEMLASWEESRARKDTVKLPTRFYDMRKRPTGRPRMKGHNLTPIGEAVYAEKEGWDNEIADPMEEEA